jgi:transcription-repair coupling factor (superfamily II helicase)
MRQVEFVRLIEAAGEHYQIKAELKDRFGPYGQTGENLFLVMELRRVLRAFLVQQISASDGRVYLLFHPESPVKVEKLLALIKNQKNRFRLSPDGRLSFTPQSQEWQAMVGEVVELLHSIYEIPVEPALVAEPRPG